VWKGATLTDKISVSGLSHGDVGRGTRTSAYWLACGERGERGEQLGAKAIADSCAEHGDDGCARALRISTGCGFGMSRCKKKS
jgi:hypothetical protein